MESEIENLQFEIKGLLFQLTIEQLMQVSDYLKISGVDREKIADRSRSSLVSYISQYVDRDEMTELEDEGMGELLSLSDMIKGFPIFLANTKEKEVNVDDEAKDKLMRELESLRLAVQQKEIEMRKLATREIKNSNKLKTVIITLKVIYLCLHSARTIRNGVQQSFINSLLQRFRTTRKPHRIS